MSNDTGIVHGVVATLAGALEPLVDAASDPSAFEDVLGRLGWSTEVDAAVLAPLSAVATAVTALRTDLDDDLGEAVLLAGVAELFEALLGLNDVELGGAGAPFDDSEFWSELAQALPALLICEALHSGAPGLYGVLSLVGVLRKTLISEDPARGRNAYIERTIDWSALGRVAANPGNLLADVYGWGGVFDHRGFMEALHDFVQGVGGNAVLLPAGRAQVEPWISSDNADRASLRILSLLPPPPRALERDLLVKLGLMVLPLPPPGAPANPPNGVLVSPVITGSADAQIPLLGSAVVELTGDFQASPVNVGFRPDGVSLESAQSNVDLAAYIDVTPAIPLLLGGMADGTRFELARAHLGFAISGTNGNLHADIDVGLDDASVVLDLGAADAFLRDVVGNGQYGWSIPIAMTWSESGGLRFSGSATPRIRLPMSLVLGKVLAIDEVEVSLCALEPDGTAVTVTATGSLDLGPFAVLFERIGAEVQAMPATMEQPGNFGLLDVALGFKSPSGLGLSVDVGVVQGGGFISFDAEHGRYAGAAELAVLNTGIAAVGVLLTKLDEPDTWSMFLSLSARFTGVQLGFGFTLNGLGGLVGVHRGLDDNALGDAVRSGALDDILFPEDPLAEASRILREMDSVFPPSQDQYVFGPVVKIGWGTPTLIELDIGVAIQLPEPLTISLLGAMQAVLPDEAAPILELHAAFAGTVNLTEGTLKIDASLGGSNVAGLLITGDLAVRMEFFDQPRFLVSFGGFHPAFDPPANFPVLDRLGIAVDTGDVLHLSLGGYFAISSNSIQFGSYAYLLFDEAGFTAEGGYNFDALIIYRPFSFSVGLSVWVSVSALGADLLAVLVTGRLTGPNPWTVDAEAEFKLLGVRLSIAVQVTFGDEDDQTPMLEIDIGGLFREALEADDAWTVLPPLGDAPVIITTDPALLVLDPAGSVQVAQRIVPLDHVVERYGDARLPEPETFSIEVPAFGDSDIQDVEDWFATEHYFGLGQDERLSAPSFTESKSGIIIGGDAAQAPVARSMTFDHEIAYRDDFADPRPALVNAHDAVLGRAVTLRSESKTTRAFTISDPDYAISNSLTGSREADLSAAGTSYIDSRIVLMQANREQTSIVPAYELELGA